MAQLRYSLPALSFSGEGFTPPVALAALAGFFLLLVKELFGNSVLKVFIKPNSLDH